MMADSPAAARVRLAVWIVLALSLLIFALQLFVLRPNLWPAGAGVVVSGDTVLAGLSEPLALPRIRPPRVDEVVNSPIVVMRVHPSSDAAAQGLAPGAIVAAPRDAAEALRAWRDAYRRGPTAAISLTDVATERSFSWQPTAVWALDAETRALWLRHHVAALMQMAGFLAGALIIVSLGSRGATATLMTLALIATAIANGGPLFGAEFAVPALGEVLLLFGWLVTPFSFPIIGLAVLNFPSKARILDRYPSIYGVLAALPLPI
ncbi:MAG: hypothetical protein M3478_04945, partial [Planctomycetota bacterium]|nr:hypothetical protein [Planctomycetota bacterium]